ncbi:hypothetical protein TNCT_624051 [Trichonephila clavata]|uniref:Uncharacterized protein n=1 Tax=Trichonephila clavata TaxID=2740835 RepID=A0A8X6IXG1_TRICU|nr:hypothetical protein TNCT_624051 [Trichonephila clavata]
MYGRVAINHDADTFHDTAAIGSFPEFFWLINSTIFTIGEISPTINSINISTFIGEEYGSPVLIGPVEIKTPPQTCAVVRFRHYSWIKSSVLQTWD